jgi:AraC-like DNA-binding protein
MLQLIIVKNYISTFFGFKIVSLLKVLKQTNLKLKLYLFLLLLFVNNSVFADSLSVKKFFVYEDKSTNITSNEIINISDFRIQEKLLFKFTSSAIWIKIPLEDFEFIENHSIVINSPSIEEVDFYIFENDSLILQKLTGIGRPISNRGFILPIFYTELPLIKPNQQLFIRLYNPETSLKPDIYLQETREMVIENQILIIGFFIFIGINFLIFMYCVFNHYSFKNIIFWFFGFYLISMSIYQGFNFGVFFMFLPDFITIYYKNLIHFTIIIVAFSWLRFSYVLLSIEKSSEKTLAKFFDGLTKVILLFLVFSFINSSRYDLLYTVVKAFYLLLITNFILVLYFSVKSILSGNKLALYFALGNILMLVFHFSIMLRNFGVIHNVKFFTDLQAYALSFESLLMFFCIDRYIKQDEMKKSIKVELNKIKDQYVLSKEENRKIDTVKEDIVAIATTNVNETKDTDEISQELIDTLEQIKNIFEKESLYLNPELKIADVSEKTNISTHQISKCINTCNNMHFFDFVNFYRVEKAKELLKDKALNQLYTIETIANLSGFNNKITFNKAFKKFTGQTASQFRKSEHL